MVDGMVVLLAAEWLAVEGVSWSTASDQQPGVYVSRSRIVSDQLRIPLVYHSYDVRVPTRQENSWNFMLELEFLA